MRALLFDFGGTLDYPRHWLDRFLAHYHAAGLWLTRVDLDPAFDAATRHAYRSAPSLKEYSLSDLIPFLVRHQLEFLRESSRVAELRASAAIPWLTARISDAFIRESVAGLAYSRGVLAALGDRLKLGVVSNFYGNLKGILRDAGCAELLTAIVDSGRLGIYKPDPAIYRAALAAIDVPASSVVMVGDSLDKDCAPAHAVGMRTVWLRHRETPPEHQGLFNPDFTIAALAELKDVLCRM